MEGRSYAVGERALRLAHRRFVGLHRRWMDSAAFRVLALAWPGDWSVGGARHPRHRPSRGGHRAARRDPAPARGRRGAGSTEWPAWRVTIGPVHVVPQPLGTVLRSCSTREVSFPGGRARGPGRRPRRRLRTTDYFTLDGLEVVPAHCLRKHRPGGLAAGPRPGLSALGRRGRSPRARRARAPRRAPDRRRGHRARRDRRPWLDRPPRPSRRTRGCSGATARGLARLWVTGGGALLGSRLQALAAELVRHARLQNAVGYFVTASASTRTRA